jgi:predicted NACHT family NTPase
MVSVFEVEIAKNLIKGLLNPKNYQRSIKEIYLELRSQFTDELKQIRVDFYETGQEIIRIVKGSFKDLSPGFRKSHNIDFELRNSSHAVFRKWKEVNEVFKEFASVKIPKYIHIVGGNGVGKSTFIQ